MLVTERMRSLGDHAKSSRQPPVKERKYAKADENVAAQVAVDEAILESSAVHESAAVVLAEDVTSQIVVRENGNEGAIADVTPDEDASQIATSALAVVEIAPAADNSTTQAKPAQEDDATSAAKRAIIHEWENWSALHSDELHDAKVADYFFEHVQKRKPHLLTFASENEDGCKAVQTWISKKTL